VTQDRPSGGLTPMKLQFAQDHEPVETLLDIVDAIKPTAIIGLLLMKSLIHQTQL